MKTKMIIVSTMIVLMFVLYGCKVDMPLPTSVTASPTSVSTIDFDKSKLEDFMQRKEIKLTAKDVQYNMVNTLDETFALSGIAELSDYYNYGFSSKSIEKKYFAIRVQQLEEDDWYLYCSREQLSEMFDDLKSGDIYVLCSAVIPKSMYKSDQGNMAFITWVEWSTLDD